ncbi:MAG: hypothetical protein ABEJ04_02600 [Halobacteriaceae archaeon]
MATARRFAVLSLVLLVPLAGCAGALPGGGAQTTAATATTTTTTAPPTGTTTTRTTARANASGYDVDVANGTLSFDANATFARVQLLLGTDADAPTVELRNLTERKGYRPGRSPFLRTFGVRNATLDRDAPGGVTPLSGKVYLHRGEGPPARVEQVLAHEFVHATQFRTNMLPWLSALDQPRLTMDLVQARVALVEGAAVYVTDAYTSEHLDGAAAQTARVADEYEAADAGGKLFYARYLFGSRYVASRVDSPANVSAAYRHYPRTTEQVLHNYTNREEPPAPLNVTATQSLPWRHVSNDTAGELVLRVALSSELSERRAAAAAAGWGNDVVDVYRSSRNGSAWGFAWTLRWDSPGEAAQFREAFAAYRDRRAARFRVVPVGEETVVVFAGAPGFVANATASGTPGEVTVGVREEG